MDIRKDLLEASKTVTEGGTGLAQKFWEWNEKQIMPYL
jgi:retinol dehydrogenase 12